MKHLKGQGSISAGRFDSIITSLKKDFKILDAMVFKELALKGKLLPNDICLTFDDGLKSQIDVAEPVLDAHGIKAFFFVYSSPYFGIPDKLELFRDFRNTCFETIDIFYDSFFELLNNENEKIVFDKTQEFQNSNYYMEFSYYSERDRLFRFFRDRALSQTKFLNLMYKLMENNSYDSDAMVPKLWLCDTDIIKLDHKENIIGLHSFSHPTSMQQLTKAKQFDEYVRNQRHLQKLLGKKVDCMSHPCGQYNDDTLKVLNKLNVGLGFRSNMVEIKNRSLLELKRVDVANIKC